jgi:uncharacterized protein
LQEFLSSPGPLFFLVGIIAARLRPSLSLPGALAKGLAAYLILAIGVKGGAQINVSGVSNEIAVHALVAAALGVVLAFLTYGLLRVFTRLARVDLAALSAHYGSVGLVTFITATGFLTSRDIPFEGHLIALLAIMEAPAIVTAIWLATRGSGKAANHALMAAFTNWSVILLMGSFAFGYVAGPSGYFSSTTFILAPFVGLLAIFLLDMGLQAGKRLSDLSKVGMPLLVFAIVMPLLGATIGATVGVLLGLTIGGATLLAVLCGSASYIAAPAAVRLALPQANPTLYGTLPLGITFPFNITLGIPLYHLLASRLSLVLG